jgi:MFS family permease
MGDEPIGEAEAPPGAQPIPAGVAAEPRQKVWQVGTLHYTFGGLVILFCWILWGDFASSMRGRLLEPLLPVMLKSFGASDTLVAALLSSVPAAMALFLSPIVSYRSDRHRGRWGRRIPYILVSAPLASVFMIGLAFSQTIGGAIHQAWGAGAPNPVTLTLIVFAFFSIGFNFAAIITGSVFGALINDVVPASFLGRFGGLFRVVDLSAAILFNFCLIGTAQMHTEWVFGVVGLLYGVGVVMMCLRVKEGEYPPPADVKPGERKSFLAACKIYFKECFSIPYYLWVFIGTTLAGMCFAPVNMYATIYATRSLGISLARYGRYTGSCYIVSLCLAYPLGVLVDRLHPLRMVILALALYAIVMLGGIFYATTADRFLIAYVAHTVLSGCFYTTSFSLGQRLFPRSTFAQFASAAGLVGSAAGIVLPFLIGFALDLSGSQYRYTFLMGSILAMVATALMLVVHAWFMRLGGPKGYVAPE